jgi:hypothetical protein
MSVLPTTTIGLHVLGFKRWYALLTWTSSRLKWRMQDKDEHAQVHQVLRVLRLAVKHAPLHNLCLAQSLTLWWLLRCYGLQSDLRIGVRSQNERILAHAWIEYKGFPLNDSPRVREMYVAFDKEIALAVADTRSNNKAKLES